MTSVRYIDIIKSHLLGKKTKFDVRKMTFQQDGASSHTAKATRAYFTEVGLNTLTWPPNSPDLNPIENIWAILKQNVEKRSAKTKLDLIRIVDEEWTRLDQQVIARTIESMKTRIAQVIDRRGLKCDY